MRFKSLAQSGYQIFAVTGTNTLSFAIAASAAANTTGLLGFAVEREDPVANERFFMAGFKVFAALIPFPDKNTHVSTFDHPVQSFVWDDFTAKPGQEYTYRFYPIKGQPKNLDRSAPPLAVTVRTEPLISTGAHDVFFNRGVASSQAYARKFNNKSPDQQPDEATRLAALRWLTRDLKSAITRFIDGAKAADQLLCCFYEFRHAGIADAIKNAINRGVDVQLIIDMKVNESTDKNGKFHASFPRVDNLKTLTAAAIPAAHVIRREAKRNDIQHNKFMVLLRGAARKPTAVWTGSTNVSDGGLYGQTNVGHWIRDATVASQYRDYWNILAADPGGTQSDTASDKLKKNKAFKSKVEALGEPPVDVADVEVGITTVFSPRRGLAVLDTYSKLLDQATSLACITLAFGVNKAFKTRLVDNTSASALTFLLLEKKDAARATGTEPFVALGARQNVYEAWGAYLRDPLAQWTRETSTLGLGLNTHVLYIHSKFLLKDPLSLDPIVVTGSANFSDPSTTDNDENMVIIRGDQRVADIYFTEFNRLFNHYYFRSVVEATKQKLEPPGVARAAAAAVAAPASAAVATQFLDTTGQWLKKYQPGKLRRKRVDAYRNMAGFA